MFNFVKNYFLKRILKKEYKEKYKDNFDNYSYPVIVNEKYFKTYLKYNGLKKQKEEYVLKKYNKQVELNNDNLFLLFLLDDEAIKIAEYKYSKEDRFYYYTNKNYSEEEFVIPNNELDNKNNINSLKNSSFCGDSFSSYDGGSSSFCGGGYSSSGE
jgi:uncharacterized membrane protein YgcG